MLQRRQSSLSTNVHMHIDPNRRCDGWTHFICSQLSLGTSATCVRAANICCLRALLDDRCDEGARLAREEEYCSSRINELGGGIRKVNEGTYFPIHLRYWL